MSKEHPITPPPELVRQWDEECDSGHNPEIDNTFDALKCFASKAARWGADQELEACCEWVYNSEYCQPHTVLHLRAARRPKPPSLKELALKTLQKLSVSEYPCNYQGDDDWGTIRRALEQLDD